MDIRTLYRYLLLEENKSISGAAKQAYMSRQAFTDSMTRMEEELGIRLFDRRTNGIVLT